MVLKNISPGCGVRVSLMLFFFLSICLFEFTITGSFSFFFISVGPGWWKMLLHFGKDLDHILQTKQFQIVCNSTLWSSALYKWFLVVANFDHVVLLITHLLVCS